MRAKIILPNLLAVLVVGLLGYFYLRYDFGAKATLRMRERIVNTRLLFERSEALRGYELLHTVRTQAMSRNVVDAFARVDTPPDTGKTERQIDEEIRRSWFRKCATALETTSEIWLEKIGKKPELAFLTNRNGRVIARNITPNACPTAFDVSKAMPSVERALDGEANYAIWSIDDSPFRSENPDRNYCQLINTGLVELAAAPVWYEDNIAGVLVVGFELSNGTARKKAEMVNFHLAVLKGGRVYSSSFATDAGRESLENQMGRPEVAAKINAVLDGGGASGSFEIKIEKEPFMALITPVLSSDKKDRLVNVVMGSIREARRDLGALNLLIVFMAVAVLIVVVAGAVLANHFLRPVMAIEEGLLKIINGAYDYRFEVKSAEVGGLSYRINQLIGVLTGEEDDEPDEEEIQGS